MLRWKHKAQWGRESLKYGGQERSLWEGRPWHLGQDFREVREQAIRWYLEEKGSRVKEQQGQRPWVRCVLVTLQGSHMTLYKEALYKEGKKTMIWNEIKEITNQKSVPPWALNSHKHYKTPPTSPAASYHWNLSPSIGLSHIKTRLSGGYICAISFTTSASGIVLMSLLAIRQAALSTSITSIVPAFQNNWHLSGAQLTHAKCWNLFGKTAFLLMNR